VVGIGKGSKLGSSRSCTVGESRKFDLFYENELVELKGVPSLPNSIRSLVKGKEKEGRERERGGLTWILK